jgi:hypothetical protein
MKPWFIQEDNVIPFPKKDTSVVRLPNVNAYPDFLTGVQDLQNHLKQGDISSDIHKKLYQDLIHRFMKVESFETPWFLREDQTSQIDQNIDKLVQIAKQNPQKSNFIKQGLDKLSNFLSNVLGQDNLKQENLAGVQQLAPHVKQQFDLAMTTGLIQQTKKGQEFLQDLLQSMFQAGAEKEFTAQKTINTEIKGIAGQLADKIAGSLDNIPAEEDKTGKPLSKKTIASKEKLKQQLIGLIQTIFKVDTTDMKSIQERDLKVEKIKKFMTACVRGIIDFKELVASKEGNIDKLVPMAYNDVYVQIKNSLLATNPGMTGANWGPGELGLAILGKPVSKAGKGDLKIGDEIIELKASSNPTKGGRFGSTALKNGGTQSKIFEKSLNDLNKTMKKKFNLTPGTKDYVYGPNIKFSWKQLSRNFIVGLNRFIKINNTSQEDVIEFLQKVAMSCIDENQINFKLDFTGINNSLNPDNTINPVKFQIAYSKMLYEIYKEVDGKEKLLIINPRSGNYKVINDAEDLDNVVYGSTIIDFSDTQAKASPQVGLK